MHSCIEPGLRLCDGRMLSKHVLSVYYVAGSQMDVTLTLMLAALVATRWRHIARTGDRRERLNSPPPPPA